MVGKERSLGIKLDGVEVYETTAAPPLKVLNHSFGSGLPQRSKHSRNGPFQNGASPNTQRRVKNTNRYNSRDEGYQKYELGVSF